MTEVDLGQYYPIDVEKIPFSWTVGYVGDFAKTVQSGFACGKHGRDENSLAHLRPMNVSREGSIDLSDVKTIDPAFNNKRLKYGDVLFNNTNSPELVGKTAFVSDQATGLAFSNHMTQVSVIDGVSPKFTALQLHHLWAQGYFHHRCVKHVNQASISATELAERIPFVCPPLDEQRRIVEKIEVLFDQIDKGVENLGQAKTTLGLYRQSLLKAAFEGRLTADWRAQNADKLESPKALLARIQKERETRYKAALDDWQAALSEWRSGGEKGKKPSKPARLPEFKIDLPPSSSPWPTVRIEALLDAPLINGRSVKDKTGGFPVLRLTALKNGKIVLAECKEGDWTENDARPFLVKRDDIFLARGNGSKKLVGIAGRVMETPMPIAFPDTMIRLRPDPLAILPEFLMLAWNSWTVRSQIEEAARTTAGIYKINQDHVSGFCLPLPCLVEQAEITRILDARLEAADAMEAEIDAALTRANALRQSILKQAFSGKLVPQDPTDEPATTLLARIRAERAKVAKAPTKKRSRATHS